MEKIKQWANFHWFNFSIGPLVFILHWSIDVALSSQLIGSLEEVHMPQNGINHPGVTALATAMQHNPQLRVLNLNDNTFTKRGAIAMAEVHWKTDLAGKSVELLKSEKQKLSCYKLLNLLTV